MEPKVNLTGLTSAVDNLTKRVQPTVSATALANPTPTVNPPLDPTPEPNTRTGSLVGNVQRDTQGFITNESENAKEAQRIANEMASLSSDGGASVFRADLNRDFQIPENLKTLQDIQLQLADRGTETAVQNTRIGQGNSVAQGNREITQNDREAAIRDAGLAARASVLQGNIETASTLVSQAVSDYTADRSFNNQQMVNQLTYFQGLADEETAQLLEQEKRKYTEDQANIERSQAAVDAAMASGVATEQDIAQLTNPKLTDEQRLSIAQGIVSRGAGELRDLEVRKQEASIGASQASTAASYAATRQREVETALSLFESGDPSAISALGYNPADVNGGIEGARQYEIEKADIQMGVGAAESLLNNMAGINLSTGAYQSPFLTAASQAIGGGAGSGALAGSVVPGAGTLAGGALGTVIGIAATPIFYSKTKTAKDEALASASFLINDTTFQEIRDLKASGVTFGNMTEGERIAAGRAATELASAAIIDESGAVNGFRGSAETIRGYVQDIKTAYDGRQEYLDAQFAVKPEEQSEAEVIWNQN